MWWEFCKWTFAPALPQNTSDQSSVKATSCPLFSRYGTGADSNTHGKVVADCNRGLPPATSHSPAVHTLFFIWASGRKFPEHVLTVPVISGHRRAFQRDLPLNNSPPPQKFTAFTKEALTSQILIICLGFRTIRELGREGSW